ncbi:hypothetical protein KH5H1_38490 [Corallococcus caeni]|nr:hypothetical protein KH5H1_38490 [Corallococcus sp. KH5-1]
MSSREMNHSRCCANDCGSQPSRRPGISGRDWIRLLSNRSASMRAARLVTVGASNRARTDSSTWNVSRSREATCVASSECPPSSKKESCVPTRVRPRSAAQTSATAVSVAVTGAK